MQAMMICATNAALFELGRLAARAYNMSSSKSRGREMRPSWRVFAEEAAKSGALVRIGYNHRFHPAFQKTRELVDAGVCGRSCFCEVAMGMAGEWDTIRNGVRIPSFPAAES